MAKGKTVSAQKNFAGGYDLLTERDAGNPVLILTGKEEYSRVFWEELLEVCEEVLADLNAV